MVLTIIVLLVLVLWILKVNIRIVPQANAYVVERLGAYKDTWKVGLHFKIPFIDKVANKVELKEQVANFDPQSVITKDNVSIVINSIIYYRVTDPQAYTYGVSDPLYAIENLTATTLRNIIGTMDLDETLSGREQINNRISEVLDESTDAWGIKVNRVEVKDIDPPRDIKEAMEKQMRAEREKREAVLLAEAKKDSDILKAEGEKQAKILQAEADKAAAIARAEGEARAIELVQTATAEGIKKLVAAQPTDEVVKLRGLEALERVGEGDCNTVIIPSEIQGIAGLAASAKELVK